MAKVLFEYTKKGDGAYNEDRIGTKGNHAWVIDGATDVFNKSTIKPINEVGWYVDCLTAELGNRCDDAGSLQKLLIDSVRAIQRVFAPRLDPATTPDYWLPNFAIVLIRIDSHKLEYYILGDCILAVSRGSDVDVFTDCRIDKFTQMNNRKLSMLRANSAPKEEMQKALQETRKYANASNGYPIGSFYGSGLAKGLYGSVELDAKSRILLSSDGMKDFFDIVPDTLSKMIRTSDYVSMINEVDAFYRDEGIYEMHVRPKKIDDQSLLIMEA